MTWDQWDSRQVYAPNYFGDVEALGRIYRVHPHGGVRRYTVLVYGDINRPPATFDKLADARSYVLARGSEVEARLS